MHPLPAQQDPPTHADIAVGDEMVISLPVSQPVPLFLPEQSSPTSPCPPCTSPVPPLFSSVAPLTINLTGDNDDDLYESPEAVIAVVSPFPGVPSSLPGRPPHPSVHPFQDEPNASAMAATFLDAPRASSTGTSGSPLYLPILPKS
ncbi:hypothetical protein EV359DRAFT_84178 [Lentinula novae-zelandiae]|nr:hypothetical protein EV359DRAFT_84178 [Lentinula novae-zelandiae]